MLLSGDIKNRSSKLGSKFHATKWKTTPLPKRLRKNKIYARDGRENTLPASA